MSGDRAPPDRVGERHGGVDRLPRAPDNLGLAVQAALAGASEREAAAAFGVSRSSVNDRLAALLRLCEDLAVLRRDVADLTRRVGVLEDERDPFADLRDRDQPSSDTSMPSNEKPGNSGPGSE